MTCRSPQVNAERPGRRGAPPGSAVILPARLPECSGCRSGLQRLPMALWMQSRRQETGAPLTPRSGLEDMVVLPVPLSGLDGMEGGTGEGKTEEEEEEEKEEEEEEQH